MTTKQINDIARATRCCCAANGAGNRINVYPDGSWSESFGYEARATEGGRVEAVAFFTFPTTREGVREALAALDAARELAEKWVMTYDRDHAQTHIIESRMPDGSWASDAVGENQPRTKIECEHDIELLRDLGGEFAAGEYRIVESR